MNTTPRVQHASNVIFAYIRNKRSEKIGIVAARKELGGVYVSYSKVNKSAGDVFNPQRGLDIALSRIIKRSTDAVVPESIDHDVRSMVDRASRYFKVPMSDVTVLNFQK